MARQNYSSTKLFPIFVLFVLVFLTSAATVAFSEEIPFGVTSKEITESGTVDLGEKQNFGIDTQGNLNTYIYKEGYRIGIEIEQVEYSINFWNVGKLGGTSGFLFWKKDYGKAILRVNAIPLTNGYVLSENPENPKLNLPVSYHLEPATNEPRIREASCVMDFSGGPTGTFEGICNNGEKITGRIGAGAFAVFTVTYKTGVPYDAQHQFLLNAISGKDLHFSSSPFGDWKVDESGLVDSGTRFNSLSGQVEVRHEIDAKGWKSAKLDSILMVDDHIKTFEESDAILSFADMSTFLMKEDTEIVLLAPPGKGNKLKMVAGKVMANIRKMMKDGSMEIDMSQAVAGIKGTTFVLEDDGKTSTLKVIEGTVEFTGKSGGAPSMVSSGETVSAVSGTLGQKTTFIVTAEEANWKNAGAPAASFPLPAIAAIVAIGAIGIGSYVFLAKKKGKTHKGK